MTVIVKICGLATEAGLDAALACGADMAGFVFFDKSTRHVSLELAANLGRRAARRTCKVLVTVDAGDALLAAAIKICLQDVRRSEEAGGNQGYTDSFGHFRLAAPLGTVTVHAGVVSGYATPVQIAGFMVALRMKGETVDEITGFARTARAFATPIEVDGALLDTCVSRVSSHARVITIAAPLSVTSSPSRSGLTCGWTMKNTPPAFRTARSPTIISMPRSTQSATRSSGRTPNSLR